MSQHLRIGKSAGEATTDKFKGLDLLLRLTTQCDMINIKKAIYIASFLVLFALFILTGIFRKSGHTAWSGNPSSDEDTPVVRLEISTPNPPSETENIIETPAAATVETVLATQWLDPENKMAERRRITVAKTAFKYPLIRRAESVSGIGDKRVVKQLSASVADHVIVKLSPGIDEKVLAEKLVSTGLKLREMRENGLALIEVEAPFSADAQSEAITRLERLEGVIEFAEPDYLIFPCGTPNDKDFQTRMWPMHNTGATADSLPGADIKAPEAWEIQNSAPGIIVAVTDTGVRYTHEDLAANIWAHPTTGIHGLDSYDNDNDPMDTDGHGTHVAGILGARGNNGKGITGVAWNVKIMPLRFIGETGGTTSDAIRVIDYARENGARIINASWGSNDKSTALEQAIMLCEEAGIIIVAAAGNDGRDTDTSPHYPSSLPCPNIVSVASTTSRDQLSAFSNYGYRSVDIAAPGSAVWSCAADSDSAYKYLSGTSMAAPHVAGALALGLVRYPTDSMADLIERLRYSTDIQTVYQAAARGRLNLYKFLNNTNFGSYANDFGNPDHIIGCVDSWYWYSSQATREVDEDTFSPNTGQHSFWFKWIAPEDGLLAFTGRAHIGDVSVVAFRGSTKATLQRIADNFALRPTNESTLRFYVKKGKEYRFSLDSRKAQNQILAEILTFTSANDMFDEATAIASSPFREEVTICGATAEPFEQLHPHAGVGKGRSVWTRWTADRSGPFTITTASSNFDTVLAVYTGKKNSLTEIASNDDTNFLDYTSKVTFNAVAGITYHIAIDSYRDEQSGSITLSGFPVGGLAIHSFPQDTVSNIGQYLDFRVLATGDSLRYIWSKDGVRLPWPTDRSALELRPVILGSLGNYSVEVRSANQSETFTWKLSVPMFAPVIEFEPLDPLILEGGVLVLSPEIIATAPVNYQWFHGGTALAGATNKSLRIENVSQSDAGEYHLVATNETGSVRTRDFRVTIQTGAGLKWVQRLPHRDLMGYLGGVSHNGSIYLVTEEGYLGYGKRVDSLKFRRFTEMRRPAGIVVHGTKLVIFGNESESTTLLPQYNHLLTSEDGKTWTRIVSGLPSGSLIRDFTSDGTTAVVLISGKIYRSTDLMNWFLIPQRALETIDGLDFANGIFMAMYSNVSGPSYWMTSLDGVNWTARTDTNPNVRFLNSNNINSANGTFFVESFITGVSGSEEFSKSSDGITWTHGIKGLGVRLADPERFAYHNGRFITTSGRTSVDGVTWQATFESSQGSGGGTALFINDGKIIRAGYQGKSVISSDTINETPVIQTPWELANRNNQVHGRLIFSEKSRQMSKNGIAWEVAQFSMEGENRAIYPVLLSHDGTDYWTIASDRLPDGLPYLFRGSDPSSMRRVAVPFQLANIQYYRLHARGNHVMLAGPEFRTSPDNGVTWSIVPNSISYFGTGLSTATSSGFILAKAESALVSLNGGVSWQSKSLNFPGHRSAPVLGQIVQKGGETIILDTAGYLLRSTNDGATWTRIDLGETGWKAVDQLGDSIHVLHQDGRIATTINRSSFTIDGTLSVEGTGLELTAFNGALFATLWLPNSKYAVYQGGAVAETDLRIAISGIREGTILEPGTKIDLGWTGSSSLGEFSSVRVILNGVEIPQTPGADGKFSIVAPGVGLNTLTVVGLSQTGLTANQTIRFFSRAKAMRILTAEGTDIMKDQKWFAGALYIAMQDGRILRTGDGSNWDLALHLPDVPLSFATTAEFIAITTERAIYVSHDGIVWEALSHSGISPDVYDFGWSNVNLRSTGGVIVAGPSFKDIRFSKNGRTWEIVPVSQGTNQNIATYFKGLWISAEHYTEAAISIDGSRAVLATPVLGFTPKLWATTRNAMVIVTSQGLHLSTDGKAWQVVGPTIQYPRKIEVIDGYFFLTLGQFSAQSYMVSRDGLEWAPTNRIPDRITNGIWRQGLESSLDGMLWTPTTLGSEAAIAAPIESGQVVDIDPNPTLISLVFQRDGFPNIPVNIKSLHAPVTNWEYGSFHATSSLVTDDGTFYAFQSTSSRVAVRSPGGVWTAPIPITVIPSAYYGGLFYTKFSGMNFRTSPDLVTWTTRTLSASTTDDAYILGLFKFSDGIHFLTSKNLHKTTNGTSFSTVYTAADFGEGTAGQFCEFQNKLVRIGRFGVNRIQILNRTTGVWSPPPSYFSNGLTSSAQLFVQNNRFHVLTGDNDYSSADFSKWESAFINVRGESLSLNNVHTTDTRASAVYNWTFPQVFTLNAAGVWLVEPEISGLLQLNTVEGKLVRHGNLSTWIESDYDAAVAIDKLAYAEVALNSPITATASITNIGTNEFIPATRSVLRFWALPDGVNDYRKRILLATVPIERMTLASGSPLTITRTVQLPDGTNPGKFSIAAEISLPNHSFDDIPTNNIAKSTETLDLQARILNLTSLGNGTINRDNVGVVYANGALVSMTASAGKGASFAGWSGDSITRLSQITLRMDSDKSIAANFTSTVGLQVSVTGAGTVSGQSSNGLYTVGSSATVTAVPDPSWIFVGWSGATTGTNPSAILSMDQPKTLNARFELSFQSWKQNHFKALLSNVTISGNNVDADGDGRSNWIEYLHGSDPLDPKSNGTLSNLLTEDFLSVIFSRNSGSQGATIIPQGSTDMSDWIINPVQERILSTDAGIETVEARLPRAGKPRAFVRMKYSTD